jgi:C4-dicarboxylate transporter, DctM subunit
MAQITPPVGFNLFVIQGLAKHDIVRIARNAFPLFVLMMVAVLGTYFFQDIVLWLPRQMT